MVRLAGCVVLLLLWSYSGFAQELISENEEFLFNSAQDFIAFEDFESAHSLLLQLDSLRPNNDKYTFNIGLCLFKGIDKVKSLYYFLKAQQLGYAPNTINYYLGLSYRFNYDLENASYHLHQYLISLSESEEGYEEKKREALELINQVESSKEILRQRLSVGVHNLGSAINSESADYVPMLLSKDSLIIFTSRRTGSTGGKISHDGSHYEDIYIAKKNKAGVWEQAGHFPGFNGKHHDANVAINKSENELYIYKVNGHGNIYVSKKNAKGKWLKPKPIKEINSRHWEGSIGLSPKEDTIYFSSDRPGGYGGSDLYFAVKNKNGKWVNIQNLGPSINTASDEDAPYMYKDGKTFFFSSKGHSSIGGYDVFSTRRTKNAWGEVKNVGFPINTVDDDIYFQLNSEASFGYFTSFRHSNFYENSIGEKDLFEITRPNSSPVFFVFKGLIYDERTKEAIPAIVSLKDLTDSTKATQKLVADVNTGRFRYDLKFENRYRLTVEIGDKVYFSKDLYFPYQPDLFETFLDIPLKDIPSFTLKLHDVIGQEKDTVNNVMLDKSQTSTVVLVRKIQPNDADLYSLLKKKIPMSFRKRLMDQLKKTSFVDDPADDQLQDVLSESKKMDSIYNEGNSILKKLVVEDKTNVERIELLNSLNSTSDQDSSTFKSLSDLEKRAIQRITDYVMAKDSCEEKTIDIFLVNTLNAEETNRVIRMVAQQLKKEIEFAKDTLAISKFRNVIDANRERSGLKKFQSEAWGILHTIETSGYKYLEQERLVFHGIVKVRSSNKKAAALKLLLTDDRGVIYKQTSTNSAGEISFDNLTPGRRYHVMVDDYTIGLLGYSIYEMTFPSMKSHQEDYLKFYYSLSPERRRAVDRIIADSIRRENYQQNQIHEWQDGSEYERLNNDEKELIKEVATYLSSTSETSADFFMNKTTAFNYEHLSVDSREKINRIISTKVIRSKEDSAFYQKLSELEKRFINQLKENRKARKIIVEDIQLSGEGSEFWYVIDEIDTKLNGNPKAITISAQLTHKSDPAANFQIALLDESNQLLHMQYTDSQGNFKMLSVTPGKKYKVLISNGTNLAQINDYHLNGLKIESDSDDFYSRLTPDEKRIVDRIMATMTANEFYQLDSTLLKDDKLNYNALTSEEKEFVERLRKHLLAEKVTEENAYLKGTDNHYYYYLLDVEQRNFINRYIVSAHRNTLNNKPIELSDHDRLFYEKLTENQKDFINNLRKQRRARADVFGENPVLMADRFWVLLDSIVKPADLKGPRFNFAGQLVDKTTLKGAPNVAMMVTDDANELMGEVTTDSLGYFNFSDLPTKYNYKILAENRRVFLSGKFNYEIRNLHLFSNKIDSLYATNLENRDLIVYFDFNSYSLKKEEMEKLVKWLSSTDVLRRNYARVNIEGHTDPIGSVAYNQSLSEKRATSIRNFFLKSGYIHDKLMSKGFGESRLRYHGKDINLNRRVEITIEK